MTAEFISPDIHCQKCAGRVQEALGKQSGVRQVAVDPATHHVRVEFDDAQVSRDQIKSTLAAAGYPPLD